MKKLNYGQPIEGKRGFVDSGKEKIYYETYGQGEPVIFTHGMAGNHVTWYQQVAYFAQSCQAVVWDQRGFGRSTNESNMLGPETSREDLLAILDELGIERAHLIGQSMGGWTALGFALKYPMRTQKIVLGDTVAGLFTPAIEDAFDSYARKVNASPVNADVLAVASHPALAEQFHRENYLQSFLYEQIGRMGEDPPASLWPICRSVSYDADFFNKLGILCLFLSGSEDPLFPPKIIREAASMITGSKVVIIGKAGHSPYFEKPRLWNDVVYNFLTNQQD